MKIITFLWRESKTHLGKSIGTILTIVLLSTLSAGLFFVYQNIVSAVSYYTSSSIANPARVEITADDNLLTLFSRDEGGIQPADVRTILSDKRLSNAEIFTLVEYPVLAKFSLFSFGLETDIPIFTVSGGTLKSDEIGISRKMLDYYNSQFAGSSTLFPEINEHFLIGQSVTITAGSSKLFNIQNTPANPIVAHIADINPDYPGFGLVLREDTVVPRLTEIGQSLGNPYKITIYMKNPLEKEKIQEQYKRLHLSFDSDKISELEEKLEAIQAIFLVIFAIIGGIIAIIIVFLLSGIFREMMPTYRILHTFGIHGPMTRFLTIGEPLGLLAIGSLISGILVMIGANPLATATQHFLSSKGLIFPIHVLSFFEVSIILISIFSFLCIILLILDRKTRNCNRK